MFSHHDSGFSRILCAIRQRYGVSSCPRTALDVTVGSLLGEKVSIGVTTLLSMTVFLMLVTDSMPPNSESLPLIGTLTGMRWRLRSM